MAIYSQATVNSIVEAVETAPNGSVPYYAYITGISAIVINTVLLESPQGQDLVKAGKIALPQRGRKPRWASLKGAKAQARGSKVKITINTNSVAEQVLASLPEAVGKDLRDIIASTITGAFTRETLAERKSRIDILQRTAQGVGESYSTKVDLLGEQMKTLMAEMNDLRNQLKLPSPSVSPDVIAVV